MTKITSAEFQKSFGQYRIEARKNAVVIASHGRDDLVLISVQEYARLRQLDQQAFYAQRQQGQIFDL